MITMTNERTGQTRQVPTGFSFTTLLFGPFVPLLRADFKWFLVMAGTSLILAPVLMTPIAWLLFAALYNGEYRQDLKNDGFTVVKQEDVVPVETVKPTFDTHTMDAFGNIVKK